MPIAGDGGAYSWLSAVVAVLTSLTGAGQVGCLAPPEGSQHLISRRCCALPPAPPFSHTRQGLACPKSCPKTATYRSLRSLQLAALTPSAARKTFKNRPRLVSRVSPASAYLDIRALAARVLSFSRCDRRTR